MTVANRPNVLFIDCHDLGRHLGCYGRAAVVSPNLDNLAANGIKFNRHFCTAPQCSPSRASLYTGRHAHSVGMLGLAHYPFDWRLKTGTRYLADYLRGAGWSTHLIGVQHVTREQDDLIRALGFDSRLAVNAPAHEVAEAFGRLLEAVEEPWFINIGFVEPHRDENGLFDAHEAVTERGVEIPEYLPDTAAARTELAQLQGAIKAVDNAVGSILTALDAKGISHNTLVVFTTDHGLALPRAKASMYDAGIEVALLMRWPAAGLIGGATVAELTSHVDVVPTVLDALEIAVPPDLQGVSMWPWLSAAGAAPSDKVVFAEKTFHTAYEPQRAVRTARYKLIANFEVDILNVPGDVLRSPITPTMMTEIVQERPPLELYDLALDPGEHHNLSGQPQLASVEAELRAALVSWMRETDDPLLTGPIGSPYREAALRELGLPAAEAPYP